MNFDLGESAAFVAWSHSLGSFLLILFFAAMWA